MTPELKQYYERRLSMMGDPAWQDLCDDILKMRNATNTLNGVDTIEKLHFRKGELSIMEWVLTLKEVSSETYQQLLEDDDA